MAIAPPSTASEYCSNAYVLAAMNLHLFLDLPLVDIPPQAEFAALCTGDR